MFYHLEFQSSYLKITFVAVKTEELKENELCSSWLTYHKYISDENRIAYLQVQKISEKGWWQRILNKRKDLGKKSVYCSV